MKTKNANVATVLDTDANKMSLTQLAALFAANPAIMAQIAAIQAPAKAEKAPAKPAKQAKKAVSTGFKGVNVSDGYTSKYGTNKAFLVYGDGTRAVKDSLRAIGGRFNRNFDQSRVLPAIGSGKIAGWIFKAEDRAKVLKALGIK